MVLLSKEVRLETSLSNLGKVVKEGEIAIASFPGLCAFVACCKKFTHSF